MRTNHSAVSLKLRRRGRWRDLRLWLGLALIVGSMLLGAAMLSSGEQTVSVWRATRDLAVGDEAEVEPITVRLADASSSYLSTQSMPSGRMRVPVAAGALVPASAVGLPPAQDGRLVTVPIDAVRAPMGIDAGDVVDVWVAPQNSDARPTLVLAQAHVHAVDRENIGVGGEIPVVLAIAEHDVAAVIEASREMISLVEVPLDSQDS